LEDTYVWLDLICTNLHVERTSYDLACLKEIIQGCNRVLIMVDRPGHVFARTWCMWELYQASLTRADKIVPMPSSWATSDLLHRYLTMDLAHMHAGNEKERHMLDADLQRLDESGLLGSTLRDAVLLGAKREMNRAEKVMNIMPRRFGICAMVYAMVLSMHCRYSEAEDVMRQVGDA
jgi:hypothetical protein